MKYGYAGYWNLAEQLATRICDEFGLDKKKLIWIEHYPCRGYPESWDSVTFDLDDDVFCNPKWQRLSPKNIREYQRISGSLDPSPT